MRTDVLSMFHNAVSKQFLTRPWYLVILAELKLSIIQRLNI